MNENIQKTVISIINTILEDIVVIDQVEKDLSQLGMDSISFIRIIIALEEAFDIEIPDEYLLLSKMNTVSKMVDIINNEIYEQDF